MKKLILLFLFITMTSFVFCIELWNGFTTEMSKEEAIERTYQILSPEKIEVYDSSHSLAVVTPSYDNFGYPSPLRSVVFHSTLPDYGRGDNIHIYFFNSKLFCISINWKYEAYEDIIVIAKIAISRYGNPQKSIRITKWGRTYDAYYWNLGGKDFYVDKNRFVFIDSVAREPWVAIQRERLAAEEAKHKAAEEDRLHKASESIHF
jgi:hypothetical protein